MNRRSVKGQYLLVWLGIGAMVAGCAELRPPTMRHALTHPWGTQAPFQLGQSKGEVTAEWGEPDEVIPLEGEETGLLREEWVYVGRYPDVPVDYKYLSRSKHLVFSGDYLVRWYEEPQPQSQSESQPVADAQAP
jgi:hypothetical protein